MSNTQRINKCVVCNGSWEQHEYRVARRDFNALNHARDPLSKAPLNEPQTRRLRELFVNEEGELSNICWNHFMEFASIGREKLSKLTKIWAWEAMRNRGDPEAVEFAPPPKKQRVAPNKIPDKIIDEIVTFCYENSSVVPDKPKIRRFEGQVPNFAEGRRQFNAEHPPSEVCYNTFVNIINEYCGHIKKFKQTKAACNKCCEFFAFQGRYNKWWAAASSEERESSEGKTRTAEMERRKSVLILFFLN